MENHALTPQQRENLKNQLIRRLGKLDDAALIQLEALTRHPAHSGTPAAGSSQPAAGQSQPAAGQSQPAAGQSQPAAERSQPAAASTLPGQDQPKPEGRKSKVSRREALAYGLSGLFALAATASGYEWYLSDSALQELRTQVAQVEAQDLSPALRAAAEKIGAELDGLAQLAQEAALKKASTTQVIEAYQDTLAPAALAAMGQLEEITGQVEGLQKAPYVEEALDTLLAMIDKRELRYFYDFLKSYKEVLPSLVSYLHEIPTLIKTNHKAVTAITPWVTNEKSVTGQILKPLQTELFPTLDTLAQQANATQAAYQSTLVVEIQRMLDERDKVSQFVSEQ